MSTSVQQVLRDDGSIIAVRQFAGGLSRGLCLQVTATNFTGETGYVQLTRAEAIRLASRLTEWVHNAALVGVEFEE
jgi:hypothetical protein